MELNQYDKMVEECRYDLPNHYSNCELFDFVIMPNHVYTIISIEKNISKYRKERFETVFYNFS